MKEFAVREVFCFLLERGFSNAALNSRYASQRINNRDKRRQRDRFLAK